jgi:hypothetical protein
MLALLIFSGFLPSAPVWDGCRFLFLFLGHVRIGYIVRFNGLFPWLFLAVGVLAKAKQKGRRCVCWGLYDQLIHKHISTKKKKKNQKNKNQNGERYRYRREKKLLGKNNGALVSVGVRHCCCDAVVSNIY